MAHPITVQWSPTTAPADAPSWENLPPVTTGKTKRGRGPGFFDEYQPGTAEVEFNNVADGAPIVDLDAFPRWQRFQILADFVGNPPDAIVSTYITELDHNLDALPFQGRATLRGTEAPGVWNRGTIALEETGSPLPSTFVGFPYRPADLIAAVDAASGTVIGDVNTYGDARAPVMLPASITVDAGVATGRFSGGQWDTIRKALDVELGTVHMTAGNDIAYNGRYTVPVSFSTSDEADRLFFSGLEDDIAGGAFYSILRGSLKMAKPMAEYHNAARVAGISKLVQAVDYVPAGYPLDAIERLDTWTADDNWTAANASLLANLYTGIVGAWPAELTVLCWTPEQSTDSPRARMAYAIQNATRRLGGTFASVTFAIPGGTPREYIGTIESVAWTFDNESVYATIGLGASAQRWRDAYADAMTFGIFTLDDPDRGLDSSAILGP